MQNTSLYLSRAQINSIPESTSAEQWINELSTVLRYHNELYYNHNAPEISDKDYDELFVYLKFLEKQFPGLVTPDSPTQKLAINNQPVRKSPKNEGGSSFAEVAHLAPMISLDNTYNAEDLRDFEGRCKRILIAESRKIEDGNGKIAPFEKGGQGDLGEAKMSSDTISKTTLSGELSHSRTTDSLEYIVEYKFDGIGIALLYEGGKLVRAATRGNGIMGEDITENVKMITSIPHQIDIPEIVKMEVRGEIIMPKSAFAQTNRERDEAGLPPYANPRNATGGALRQLDPQETKKRNLECFLYHISYIQAVSGQRLAVSEENENPLFRKEGWGVLEQAKISRSIPLAKGEDFSPVKNQGDVLRNGIKQSKSIPLLKKSDPMDIGSGVLPAHRSLNEGGSETEMDNSPSPLERGRFAEGESGCVSLSTQLAALEFMQKTGLPTHPQYQICRTIDEIIELTKELETTRNELPFEVDGLVVKVNNFSIQQKLGATEHHPRWAVAYKFAAHQAVTKLNNIVFQVGRTGVVTPVAELEPVQLAGVTIRNATLHNADEVEKKGLMIGDMVLIERAGDVIPQVIRPLVEKRNGAEKVFIMLQDCPECASSLVREEGEVAWRCVNPVCPAQIFERIRHFVSKDAMDIENLGEKTVDLLLKEGKIASFADIYTLRKETFDGMAGFAELAISNILNAVEKSKSNDLWRLIHGLGIRHVGKKTAKVLAKNVENLWDLAGKSVEQLSELPDIGGIVAQSIVDYFANEKNKDILHQLEQAGVNFTGNLSLSIVPGSLAKDPLGGIQLPHQSGIGGGLSGKTFVFTGNLANYTREEAQEAVERLGAKTSGSVSKNTSYVVAGDKPGSKVQKAQELGIMILDEEGFRQLL